MLDDAGLQPGGLDRSGSPYSSERADHDVDRALDVDVDVGEAQAPSSSVSSSSPTHSISGLTSAATGRLLVDPVDEQAVKDAHLVGRQAHADRVDHELAHALDLVAQCVVEALDRPRPRAQHRLTELPDMRQSGGTARRHLGIELGLLLRAVGLGDLGVELGLVCCAYRPSP